MSLALLVMILDVSPVGVLVDGGDSATYAKLRTWAVCDEGSEAALHDWLFEDNALDVASIAAL